MAHRKKVTKNRVIFTCIEIWHILLKPLRAKTNDEGVGCAESLSDRLLQLSIPISKTYRSVVLLLLPQQCDARAAVTRSADVRKRSLLHVVLTSIGEKNSANTTKLD